MNNTFVIENDNASMFGMLVYDGHPVLIYVLLIMMVIDVLTGILVACIKGTLWSRKSYYGYARKMMLFLIIILANCVDTIFDLKNVAVSGTVIFYICNEALSVLENASKLGVKVPGLLVEQIKNKEQGKEYLKEEIKEEFTSKGKPN